MPLSPTETLMIILSLAAATIITRALPFIVFPAHKETPVFLLYLSRVLPSAAIGFLVVYCLKNVRITVPPHGLPEACAVIFTAALHYWKNNTLLSIGAGTFVYIVLLQLFPA